MKKYYCFAGKCFIGIMNFLDDGEITMEYEDDSKLDDYAKLFKKLTHMRTTEEILKFISVRVPDRQRKNVDVWLIIPDWSLCSSDIEIFQKNHGVSINDVFFIDEEKKLDFYYNVLEPIFSSNKT